MCSGCGESIRRITPLRIEVFREFERRVLLQRRLAITAAGVSRLSVINADLEDVDGSFVAPDAHLAFVSTECDAVYLSLIRATPEFSDQLSRMRVPDAYECAAL